MKELLENVLQMNQMEREHYMSSQGQHLLEQMVEWIGIPDDELRDKLNYRLFIELLSTQLITRQQMNDMTEKLASNDYLYSSIGDKDTDSVFLRSYSALWLSNLINVDAQLHFLTEQQATTIIRECTSYLSKEQDTRGFLDEKGWALAITNGADLLTSIVSHPSYELNLTPKILEGIKDSLWKGTVYTADEEEKFTAIIEKLINKDVPEALLIEWIEQVFDKLEFYLITNGYTPQYFSARTNTLHFMKNLYFILKFTHKMDELKGVVSIFIGKWLKS
ncbi:DUF2785 domain-containing protein [Ureibacillus sp. MALMAid1270]|uniref:DUF2785 domain-containing protein n=1 Tax=Ureibacillus sp. MALMAid1270 TaxID=3411629 RepID=UPI003BA3F56F